MINRVIWYKTMKTKTKVLIFTTAIYLVLLSYFIVLMQLDLDTYIFSIFISSKFTGLFISVIYLMFLGIMLLFFKFGWLIKILNLLILYPIFKYLMALIILAYFYTTLGSTTLKLTVETNILIRETNAYEYRADIYQIKGFIFTKYIGTIDHLDHLSSTRDYRIEKRADEITLIIEDANEDYNVYLYFKVNNNKLELIDEVRVPKNE